MARSPRIDEPGLIHHVIARGIERRQIFNDGEDAEVFLARLAKLVQDTDVQILAFSLVSNHFHLLVRRASTPIFTFMQRLLTAYALYFNRRHERSGHLFQNRYKSILCRDERHFLELVRYIHLNPLRAGLVSSIDELGHFPYCGHKLLIKGLRRTWFNPDGALEYFGSTPAESKRAYIDFLAAGIDDEADSIVPGGSEMPEEQSYLQEGPSQQRERAMETTEGARDTEPDVQYLIRNICLIYRITQKDILGDSRKRTISQARSLLAFRMSKEMGLSGSDIGRRLYVTRSAASKMISRGREIDCSNIF